MIAREGVSKEAIDREIRGQTVTSRFVATVAAHRDHVALHWKDAVGDGWTKLSFAGYAHEVAKATTGLNRLGVTRGDRVVLMMRNIPQFHIADIATLMTGATPVSLYNSSSTEQIRGVVGHCRAKVAIVEDLGFGERILSVRDELPDLEVVIVVQDPSGSAPPDVRSWADLLANEPADLTDASARVRPDDVATIIYTSGTTGPSKGVLLTHTNIVWTSESYMRLLEIEPLGFRAVSYLPMAHVAERVQSHYLGVIHGYQVTTCPDPDQLLLHLLEARPQVFFGVPRIWERLRAGLIADLAADAKRKAAFDNAFAAARPLVMARLGRDLTASERHTLRALDRRVFRAVRDLVGLDAVELAVTGAAPIPIDVLEWFLTIGVPISETYGLSENTGPLTWDPYELRPGTVGRPMPGVTIRLADDGEILATGGNVFAGYLDDPDQTAAVLDDGWLQTGDVGAVDDDGYLRIVDRKKELIITAGGENVSPANLEAALLEIPLVSQACAIGDRRPFVSALLVLDTDAVVAWAHQRRISFSDPAALVASDEVEAEVGRHLDDVMRSFNSAERVKRVVILADEWLADSEELTPTMKLKRRGIQVKYAREIDSLYI